MKSRRSLFSALLALLLIAVILDLHFWLWFPVLHLRVVIVGLLPLLSFLPLTWNWIDRLAGGKELDPADRWGYASFGALCLASVIAFILLTLHCGYPLVFLTLAAIALFLNREWWKARILEWRSMRIPVARKSEAALLILAGIISCAAALIPPVGPPVVYDAHEYHLVAPEQYLHAGGWIAFPYNVYCAFPMNVELLYLWPLAAASPAGCTFVNFVLAAITALVVWRLGQRWGMPRDSLLAPLLFLSTGLVTRIILQANIDLGAAAATGVLFLAYERFRESKRSLDAGMMAVALGFAFGSKYIAALCVGFPFLIMMIYDFRRILRQRLFWSLLIVLGLSLLFFLPWMIRNVFLYQNPFYPLLTSVFGGVPDFFQEVFKKAHAAPTESLGLMLWNLIEVPFKKSLVDTFPLGFSCLWLMGLPVIFVARREHPFFRTLVFMTAAYGAWFFFTQRNDRFLLSIVPLMALTGAYGVYVFWKDSWFRLLHNLVLGIVVLQLYAISMTVLRKENVEYLLQPTLEEIFLARSMPHYQAIDWLNQQMENPAARVGDVLFIGEAQSYGARFSAIAPTVFNYHPLEQGLPSGVTHILFNGSELNRLRKGYEPLGWPMGARLQEWMDRNRNRLKPVYDAYPEKPGLVVVYAVKQ